MRRPGFVITATTLAACVAVVLAGCTTGGDDEPARVDRGTVECGLGNGKKATGEPIKVGAIMTASGGVDFSSAPTAARAYFDCVNANGGIDGRPIQYQTEDDGLNPQRASQLATKLADDPDVVALAGGSSFVACGVSGPIWQRAGLFEILATGVPRACYESPNIAPVNAGPRISAIAAAQYAVEKLGAKRIAQISNNAPGVGDWTQDGVRAYVEANTEGVEMVGDVLHDPGIRDANAVLLQALRDDPDAIILQDPAPDDAAILKAAQTMGLKDKVDFVCLTPCYDITFPDQVGDYWQGFVSNSEFAQLDADTPDNKQWHALMNSYAPKGAPQDSFAQGGYLSAKILVDTLLDLDGAITRESVNKAIVAIADYESDILCAPWYYGTAQRHNANHTTRYVQMDGDGWKTAADCTETQDPELEPIIAAEKNG